MSKTQLTNARWFRSKPKASTFAAENIDREAGTIKNIVLCEVGPAKGHGVELEQEFINDALAYAKEHHETNGLKCRFGHPALSDTTMGTQLGFLKNFRVEGEQLKGDLQLLEAAKNGKNGQNLWQWTFDMAEQKPDFIMSSIVFVQKNLYQYDEDGKKYIWFGYDDDGNWIENSDNLPFANKPVYISLKDLLYNDLVEQGAATDNMFSDDNIGSVVNSEKYAIIAGRFSAEHPELVEFLKENPAKIIDFCKSLDIELTVKNTFSGFLSQLFSKKEEDIEAFKTEFKKEIEKGIETKLSDKYNSHITELETQFKAQIKQLEESLSKKDEEIKVLNKRPLTTHTLELGNQNFPSMSELPAGKQIYGFNANKLAVESYNRTAKQKGLDVIDESTAFATDYTTEAAAYQDHAVKYRVEIMAKALESFRTRAAVTSIPAIKGKVVVTEQVIGDIVKKWKPLDDSTAGQNISLKPHELETTRLGIHEKLTPADLENTYLADLRKTGQNPMDFPFEQFLMQKIAEKIAQFLERVFWRGVKVDGSDAGTAQLDGILHQIADAITATTLTVTTLGNPVIRKSQDESLSAGDIGTVELLEDLIQSAPDALVDNDDGLSVFMRRKLGENFQLEHRNLYKSVPKKSFEPFNIEGLNAEAYPLAGINTNRVIATPAWNIIYGYDADTDIQTFNTQYHLNQLHIYGAFRIAAKILIMSDDVVLVNELG